MKKIILFLTLLSFIFLFKITETQTPVESGNLNPGTFTCNYDLCTLNLNYVFTQGGCGNTGVMIKSDNDQIFLGCRIVHNCDPGDSCGKRSTQIMNLTMGQSAELSCCYARVGSCTFSPENCKWGWDRNNVGIKYEASYSTYDLDDTTSTTSSTTVPTTIPSNCRKVKICRSMSIHGICLTWRIEYICDTTTTTIHPGCQPPGSICKTNYECCSNICQETRICYNKSIHGICLSWRTLPVCR
jgi:hypothetical protein